MTDIDDIEDSPLWRQITYLETNGYKLEDETTYEPQGHHPVHPGDSFPDSGRYRVLHKLGSGGYGNVWLCRDMEAKERTAYKALKITIGRPTMEGSSELILQQLKDSLAQSPGESEPPRAICFSVDNFIIQGPNGYHECFVYPLLGPPASFSLFQPSLDLDRDLRNICLEITKALQWLHDHGICHGDLTPNNVLNRVTGLDGLSEEEVLQIVGAPHITKIDRQGERGIPDYLVYPIMWCLVDKKYVSKEAYVIDFGESFKATNPPLEVGTPWPYRAPELILENNPGIYSDLWALGCTLFEIRTGRELFNFCLRMDDILQYMVCILGKFHEPWWSTTWKLRKRIFKDEVDETGSVVRVDGYTGGTRSLSDRLASGVLLVSGRYGREEREISESEKNLCADFLQQFLRHRPGDRISAGEASTHAWLAWIAISLV